MDSIPSWMTEKEKEDYRLRDQAEWAAIEASIVAWFEGEFDEETSRLQAAEYAAHDWEVVEEEGGEMAEVDGFILV